MLLRKIYLILFQRQKHREEKQRERFPICWFKRRKCLRQGQGPEPDPGDLVRVSHAGGRGPAGDAGVFTELLPSPRHEGSFYKLNS